MNPDEEWKTWQEWLGTEPKGLSIYAEVVEMLAFRKIWRGFSYVHNQAPAEARKYSTFVWWINWNYARSMGLAVRRQTDRDPDVISLGKLIDRIWRYPTVVTLERILSLRDEDDRPGAARWFDQNFGPGPFMNPEIPARDWHLLWDGTRKVRQWVNKAVAHPGRRERTPPPYSEIHRCVDLIFELFQKYTNLIQGVHVVNEVVMDPWPAIFRTAWIPEERLIETMTEIERVEREGL